MKVSVIIPVYGVEEYLVACLQSVLTQTYKNIEIILVDDGGKDKCPAMCDAFAEKDGRIQVIHKENGGQGTARNAALDIAVGDYVLFVDSDDTIQSDMVEKLVTASKNGFYDAVLCGYCVYNSLRIVNTSWYSESFEADNQRLMLEYVKGNIFTAPSCKLFRRSLFDRIRFPSFRANEDAFIMHRLFGNCNKAYFLNEHLYQLTLRNDSTEGKGFNTNKLHMLDCANDLREYISEKYPQYIKYVQNKTAKETLLLLKMLYSLKDKKQYATELEKLRCVLSEERNSLNQNGGFESTVRAADEYLRYPSRFAMKIKVKKTGNHIKRFIKNTIILLRGQRKEVINDE